MLLFIFGNVFLFILIVFVVAIEGGVILLFDVFDLDRINAAVYENIFYTFWRDYGRISFIFYLFFGDFPPKYYEVVCTCNLFNLYPNLLGLNPVFIF